MERASQSPAWRLTGHKHSRRNDKPPGPFLAPAGAAPTANATPDYPNPLCGRRGRQLQVTVLGVCGSCLLLSASWHRANGAEEDYRPKYIGICSGAAHRLVNPAAFKAASMIGPGTTFGEPGGWLVVSGGGKPAAFNAAAISPFRFGDGDPRWVLKPATPRSGAPPALAIASTSHELPPPDAALVTIVVSAFHASAPTSPSPQDWAMWWVEERPTSRKNGPAAPQLATPNPVASGTPCPMLLMEKASTSVLPLASFQIRRIWPASFSSREGWAASPFTSVHCRMMSSPLEGLTIGSAMPCQTETLGQGPWCSEAARTRSPKARVGDERSLSMASNASCTDVAHP